MAESSRSLAKKAGGAAVERAIHALMPELLRRLDRIDDRVAGLDRELHGLREHIDARFEQNRDLMNELGHRIARVEGRLDEVVRALDQQTNRMDRQSDKMDQWIERLVRVEMTKNVRRGKRAG